MGKFYITYIITTVVPEHMARKVIEEDGTPNKVLPKSRTLTFSSKSRAIRYIFLMVNKGYDLIVPDSLKFYYRKALMDRVHSIKEKFKNDWIFIIM